MLLSSIKVNRTYVPKKTIEQGTTYVPHAHSYNEGGEGSILRGPLRDNQLLHRLVINAEIEKKAGGPKGNPMLTRIDADKPITDWAGKDILLILSVFTKILHLCRICVDCI